jgi:hypothetical protein
VVAKKKVVLQREGTWDYEDDDFITYTHGKPLLPKCKIAERDFWVKIFQGWYMKAHALAIEFIQAKVPRELFNSDPFNLHMP